MKAIRYSLVFVLIFITQAVPLRAQDGQSQPAQPTVVQQPVSAQVSMDSMGVRRYLLGPGDTIDVRVFGQSDMNWVGEVDSDGNIASLPFVEKPIRAQCRTENDVAKDIRTAYSKFLKDPQISVRVTGRNSRPPAIVFGAVRLPQRIQMQRRVRLYDLLALSGGLTERTNGKIQIFHTEPLMCPEPGDEDAPVVIDKSTLQTPYKVYNVKELMAGKEEANPFVRPGDVVTALEADPIYITGFVQSPQGVFLREGLRLSTALAMVGGVRKEGKQSAIVIYRVNPKGENREAKLYDMSAIKKGKGEDPILEPYDIIEVPEDKPSIFRVIANGVLNIAPNAIGSLGTNLPLRVIY